MRRLLLLAMLASIVAMVSPSPKPASLVFGVLGSKCDAARSAALHAAGVSVAELPMGWDRYEPVQGRVDTQYVTEVRARVAACRSAGVGIILAPGLHYTPAWVRALPGGTQRNSSGSVPDDGGADVVFSASVREAARKYLTRLATDIGFEGVVAVRVGTKGGGELGYPDPVAGDSLGYWAFGEAPQSGVGIAEGMAPSPLPGWVPGSPRWADKEVTPAMADAWWTWYTRSVIDAVVWQIGTFRGLGFSGSVHVPVAGRGVLPVDRATAVAGLLDGRADPDGALGRGLDYPAQFAVLSGQKNVAVDFTGLDDVTAVRARARNPAQDRCRPGDDSAWQVSTDVSFWSSQRFTSAVAHHAGLSLVGENPGSPELPRTGGAADSDPVTAQLQWAPDYASQCGMTTFLFAFEDELFGGMPSRPAVLTLEDYAARIRAAKEQG